MAFALDASPSILATWPNPNRWCCTLSPTFNPLISPSTKLGSMGGTGGAAGLLTLNNFAVLVGLSSTFLLAY